MTYLHEHVASYLEPDEDDEDGPGCLSPEAAAAASEFLRLHPPFTIEFRPYVTPREEIPRALGGLMGPGVSREELERLKDGILRLASAPV